MKQLLLLWLLLLPFLIGAHRAEEPPLSAKDARPSPLPNAKFPAEVTAADGTIIDIAQLAKDQRVVVVTLKAAWCLVCQQQLVRIKQQLDQIEYCSVSFLVLSPGSADELNAIQQRTAFPYPFIADKDLEIGTAMHLVLSKEDQELIPAIFMLNPDRSVGWIQLGRNPIRYGDTQLFAEIDCGDWI